MTINFTLLDREVAFLRANPEKHNQRTYGNLYGTACLAGWTMIHLEKREGRPRPTPDKLWEYAQSVAIQALGLSDGQARALFDPKNTIENIEVMAAHLREHPDADQSKLLALIGWTDEELISLVSWADED